MKTGLNMKPIMNPFENIMSEVFLFCFTLRGHVFEQIRVETINMTPVHSALLSPSFMLPIKNAVMFLLANKN